MMANDVVEGLPMSPGLIARTSGALTLFLCGCGFGEIESEDPLPTDQVSAPFRYALDLEFGGETVQSEVEVLWYASGLDSCTATTWLEVSDGACSFVVEIRRNGAFDIREAGEEFQGCRTSEGSWSLDGGAGTAVWVSDSELAVSLTAERACQGLHVVEEDGVPPPGETLCEESVLADLSLVAVEGSASGRSDCVVEASGARGDGSCDSARTPRYCLGERPSTPNE